MGIGIDTGRSSFKSIPIPWKLLCSIWHTIYRSERNSDIRC